MHQHGLWAVWLDSADVAKFNALWNTSTVMVLYFEVNYYSV